eukprot:3936761-Rhodomonas_salina.1
MHVTYAIPLRPCYAIPGTDVGYATTSSLCSSRCTTRLQTVHLYPGTDTSAMLLLVERMLGGLCNGKCHGDTQ